MSTRSPPHVVVLGGGSAGWITACLLHHEWGARGGKVTVVESSDIGIIGVGEGSTPQLKAFFDHLGIEEGEWMPACDATYKLGIRFTGWSERPDFGSYFHPFPSPVDLHSEPGFTHNCALARRGFDVPAGVLERPVGEPWQHSPEVEAAWAQIYNSPKEHWDLYELAEKLVDLEYHFQRWRFGHLKTVERIIGFKTGTGGTAGTALSRVLRMTSVTSKYSV